MIKKVAMINNLKSGVYVVMDKSLSYDVYKAYIAADQGIFSGKTYSAIWTRDDWRNPTLGRLLFWNVYGNEYTPTSWNP